jgi:hypothetical protein
MELKQMVCKSPKESKPKFDLLEDSMISVRDTVNYLKQLLAKKS